jgi:hypothetical protein
LGLPLNKEAAAEAEKVLTSSLSTIENIWLKGDGQYLLGGFRPSIADLSLVCEIMQLQVKVVLWSSYNIKLFITPYLMEDVLLSRFMVEFEENKL